MSRLKSANAEALARQVRAARRPRNDSHDRPLHQIRLVRPGSLGPIDPKRVESAPRQEEAFRPQTMRGVLLRVLIVLAIACAVALVVRAALR